MTISRKLEDIVSNLDDMSTTIEEIKEQAESEPIANKKLDSLQTEMTRTAELIEESLEISHPASALERPNVPVRRGAR